MGRAVGGVDRDHLLNQEMEMAQSGRLKIAITTNDLVQANANFASARQIVFYEVSGDEAEFVDCAQFKGGKAGGGKGPGGGVGCGMQDMTENDGVDLIEARVSALAGCAILFTRALNDPHAVRVKNAGVFPVKMENSREIAEVIEYVQKLINNNPPLWIRRALGIARPELQVA